MTQFLYDGDRLVAEYNGSGTLLRRYVHGTGSDEPLLWYEGAGLGTRRGLLADHQGSIIAVTTPTGSGYAINAYDAWGIPNPDNDGRFQYTGQAWLPELGLYHYKARIYSPGLGRFLQTDPIGYDDQMNLYAYVGNDPLNKMDPTGEFAQFALLHPAVRGAVGFVVGAAAGGIAQSVAQLTENGLSGYNEKVALAAAMASGATGAAFFANPALALNPAASSVIGGIAGALGSAGGDLANGQDIDPGKALVSGLAAAVGTPIGGQLSSSNPIAGAIIGEAITQTAGLLMPATVSSANDTVNAVGTIVSESVQQLDSSMRRTVCPGDLREGGCN